MILAQKKLIHVKEKVFREGKEKDRERFPDLCLAALLRKPLEICQRSNNAAEPQWVFGQAPEKSPGSFWRRLDRDRPQSSGPCDSGSTEQGTITDSGRAKDNVVATRKVRGVFEPGRLAAGILRR